jgi:hypothetical protein|tara:strand:- start:3857 stop:4132 length:276 start_codon:yes stop_codon:yes gene_type:complete
MRKEIEDLVVSINEEISRSRERSKQGQIAEMLKDGGDIKTYNGKTIFDTPALDLDYAIYSDAIVNRLNDMYKREEITYEELYYVTLKTDLL